MTFTDVEGKEVTEDVETADPFAGSLDVILPQGFNEVTAPGATVAGNGQNETQLGYTFLLFPPLGSAEVKVGYQSRISNGQMPAAEFSFLPIVPFDNSTIAGTTEALKGGAATGAVDLRRRRRRSATTCSSSRTARASSSPAWASCRPVPAS